MAEQHRKSAKGDDGVVAKGMFKRVEIAPLVLFRACFGFLILYDFLAKSFGGSVRRNFIEPSFHFRYYGFEWVPVPPGNWMYALVGLICVAAAGVMLGAFYRVSALALFAGLSWFFLIEQAEYLNHYYFACLLALIACVLPANESWAVDSEKRGGRRSSTAPFWTLWLLRFQMGVVYFFGGVAKINSDWLVAGEPVRTWLREMAGERLEWLSSEVAVRVVCWGGMLFDLLVVPLLLWKQTRKAAVVAAVGFHLCNAMLFEIGIFPLLSIAMTLLFLEPREIKRILGGLKKWMGFAAAGEARVEPRSSGRWRRWTIGFVTLYVVVQVGLPLRHFLYPGSVHWTEEGHRYAWHMKLREKTNRAQFWVVRPGGGGVEVVEPSRELTARQAYKMGARPDMILQYAQHVGRRRGKEVSVHAEVWAGLNGRPEALLIDPTADLMKQERSPRAAWWILPLGNTVRMPSWFSAGEKEKAIQ